MKNKYLIIAVVIGLTAIALIFISNNYNSDTSSGLIKPSKSMENSLSACKNAIIDIDGFSYKLKNEVASQGDSVLTYGKHSIKGLIDSGPINDAVCTYDLTSDQIPKKTYISVLLGYTNEVYSTAGTLLLGSDITITNLRIANNKVLVSFKDVDGKITDKVVAYDGEMINFVETQ